MKGDFSRLTFRRRKRFSGVRMQQGRVQLDADWNEQVDITEHVLSSEILDLVGHSGGPENGAAFRILTDKAAAATAELGDLADGDFVIGPGRYYVAGLLLENHSHVTYLTQPDYPGAPRPPLDNQSQVYLAYLDVWQRHITGLEDPEIGEPALGGADTATRTKHVWQFKLRQLEAWEAGDTGQIGRLRAAYRASDRFDWEPPISDGTMAARVASGANLENQLYRVEIHNGGPAAEATFKWSRDNGAVAARVVELSSQGGRATLTLASAGRDPLVGFAVGEWVELTDEGRTLRGEPGLLGQIEAVGGAGLTVNWAGNAAVNGEPSAVKDYLQGLSRTLSEQRRKNEAGIVVRRWDSAGAARLGANRSHSLEDNIQVEFSGRSYKSGDYWLIAARNLTGDIDWPAGKDGAPEHLAPHGVRHHYCSLALLRPAADGKSWELLDDLRTRFKSLAADLVSKGGDTIDGAVTINKGKDETALTVNGPAVLNAGLTLRPTLVARGNVNLEQGSNANAPVPRANFYKQFTGQLDQAILLARVGNLIVNGTSTTPPPAPPVGWVEGRVTDKDGPYRTIIFLNISGRISFTVSFDIYAIFLNLDGA